MCWRTSFTGAASLLVASVPLLLPASAAAQRSRWGNPAVTFGWTPYNSISNGHAYYPGGDGFIPGYGYYPGIWANRYPWLDGPVSHGVTTLVPFSPGAGSAEAVAGEVIPSTAAVLSIRVPSEAEIWFSETKTSQQGEYRRFVTPPLESGRTFWYDVRARWLANGKAIQLSRRVQVRAGDRLTVDFVARDPDDDRALIVPTPRKIELP